MSPIDDSILNALLNNDGERLFITESHTIEFKSNFDWNSSDQRAKYCKSMAAFCNNSGGYLIFGIDDTGEIIGTTEFNKVDTAKIVDHVNNYLAPSISIHKRNIMMDEKEIGIIYIEKYNDIPTICIKSAEPPLKEGTIYYRYSAKSEAIKVTDLIQLLHQLRGGNSKEMVELEKVKMKRDARPRLTPTISGGGAGGGFRLGFRNDGKRLKIIGINVSNEEIIVTGIQIGGWIEETLTFHLNFMSKYRNSLENTLYEIEIIYEDDIETRYKITGKGKGRLPKFEDPIEIP